jgi:hypothetical protein
VTYAHPDGASHLGRRFWVPTYAHPNGESQLPDYLERDGLVFPHNRSTPEDRPWLIVSDERVFAADGHPDGPSDVPWFLVIGSFVYPTAAHPQGWSTMMPAYWFAAEDQLAS